MNIDFDNLNLPAGAPPGFGPMQRPAVFPNYGPSPIPPVLTPQQQAILQALTQRIAANSSLYAPAPSDGQPPVQTPPATVPRYQVVKHPNAPARLPYVIQDNATGGYVTGGSPLFPRLFSTASEASDAIPSDETVPADPGALSSSAQYETRFNPDAPARMQYSNWNNDVGDWARDQFGFAHGFSTQKDADLNKPTETTAGRAARVESGEQALAAQMYPNYLYATNTQRAGSSLGKNGLPGDMTLDANRSGLMPAWNMKQELANTLRPDQTNGWGPTYWRAFHSRKVYLEELAAYRAAHPNQPDDPVLVAHIQMYNGQIEHMNSVRPSGELPADYASDGGNPNRKSYGATAKAAPDWFYSGLADIAGAGANLTGDISDLLFGLPVNAIDSVIDPNAPKLQFNTEPYYGYTAPPTLRGQFWDLPHALSTAATDLYNHPIFTLLQQGQYIDPNLAFGAPSGLDDAAAAYQLRRLSQAEKDTTASPDAAKVGVTEPVYWKAKQVSGKKVYQRDDLIDPNRVGPDGRTNLELMQNGEAPYGPDGKRIHLHHMTQEDNSPVAEVTQSFHDKYRSIIHIDPPTVRTRINRVKFRPVRKNYWKTRANDFLPQENR